MGANIITIIYDLQSYFDIFETYRVFVRKFRIIMPKIAKRV